MNISEQQLVDWLKKLGRIQSDSDFTYHAKERPRIRLKNGDSYEAKALYGGNKLIFYEAEFEELESFQGNFHLNFVIFDQTTDNPDPLAVIQFPLVKFGQEKILNYRIDWVHKKESHSINLDPGTEREASKYLVASGFSGIEQLVNEQIRRWMNAVKETENAQNVPKNTVSSNTLKKLMPQWTRNIVFNLQFNGTDIQSKKDILELDGDISNGKKRMSVCVGAGPSLKKYGHIKKLKEFQKRFDGLVLACDRSLPMCIEAGVVPDIVSTLDGDPSLSKYFDDPIVKKHQKDIKGVFSVVAHPDIIEKWKGEPYFFVPFFDDPLELDSATRLVKLMTGKTIMSHGGNVGMFNWFCSITPLYCNPIALLGMDLSWPMPINIQETETYEVYKLTAGGNPEEIEKNYRRDYNPFFKNEALVDTVMNEYIQVATNTIPVIEKVYGIKTINCSGGGALHSIPGLDCLHFDDFILKYDAGEYKNIKPPQNTVRFEQEDFYDKKENIKTDRFNKGAKAILEKQFGKEATKGV